MAALLLPRLSTASALGPGPIQAGDIRSLFSRPEAAKRIGLSYVSAVPQERDAARLRELVFADWHPAARDRAFTDPGAFRKLLLAQSRQDFRHGHVVQLDGWLLSRTEVRVCALLAVAG